jgi:hypothetical protein
MAVGEKGVKGKTHKARGPAGKRRPKSGRRDKPINRGRYTRPPRIIAGIQDGDVLVNA